MLRDSSRIVLTIDIYNYFLNYQPKNAGWF